MAMLITSRSQVQVLYCPQTNIYIMKQYSKIEFCTDFSEFSKIKGNRSLKESKIRSGLTAIKANKLLPPGIIHLSSNKIIDGQHRIVSCIRAQEEGIECGLWLCYADISDDEAFEMVIDINASQSPWTIQDYLNSYYDFGNINYVNFINLQKHIKLTYYIDASYCVIMSAAFGNRSTKNLKTGKLIFTNDDIVSALSTIELYFKLFRRFKTDQVASMYKLINLYGFEVIEEACNSLNTIQKLKLPDIYDMKEIEIIFPLLKKLLNLPNLQ